MIRWWRSWRRRRHARRLARMRARIAELDVLAEHNERMAKQAATLHQATVAAQSRAEAARLRVELQHLAEWE
jgi:hypothetical protein